MKYGLDVPITGDYADPRTLAELAAEADAAGWDGFFIWDTVFASGDTATPVADPWIALAAIAARTTRIRFGAMVTPLPRYLPWQLARQTAALDQLSGGRLIFAAGLGYQALDFVPFADEYDPKIRAGKLDEGLEIMARLWRGETFSFAGRHYQLDGVRQQPTPVQSPRIPVWLAAGWPRRQPLRRAARWDGVYLMTVNQQTDQWLRSAEIAEVATYVRSVRASDAPFDIAFNGATLPDGPQAAKLVAPYAAAGATWWVELAQDTLAAYCERIRRGPPKG